MVKTVKTKDRTLEVHLLESGMVEIESRLYHDIGIEVQMLDPTKDVTIPEGAIYRIDLYVPDGKTKVKPSEYDIAWITSKGEIIHRKDRRNHP